MESEFTARHLPFCQKTRENWSVILTILIIMSLLVVSLGGLAYFANASARAKGESLDAWVADSVQAWRSKDLDTDDFDVRMKDTNLDDVFSTFEAASGPAYVTPSEIRNEVTELAAPVAAKMNAETIKATTNAVKASSARLADKASKAVEAKRAARITDPKETQAA